jgi:cis-3-alkyl-4-acyloxetan-2-one decarboxylase
MGWLSKLRGSAPLLHVATDEGSGPVVVLVHGIASSSNTFRELVPLLTPTHRVIALDILGFGKSPQPPGATYDLGEHVAAVHATIRSLRLRAPFVLVGHSLGALISSRYAAVHPHSVAKLVLVSPPIYVEPSALGDPRERAAMGLYLRLYEYLRANKKFTMRAAAGLDRISPIRNAVHVSESNWTPFVLSLENVIESQTAVSDLAHVRVPVHVVYGTLDPFLMPAGLRIVERMRHVTMHRVDANDHLVRKRLARVVAAAIE